MYYPNNHGKGGGGHNKGHNKGGFGQPSYGQPGSVSGLQNHMGLPSMQQQNKWSYNQNKGGLGKGGGGSQWGRDPSGYSGPGPGPGHDPYGDRRDPNTGMIDWGDLGRTMEFRDSNGNRIDDRDEAWYGHPNWDATQPGSTVEDRMGLRGDRGGSYGGGGAQVDPNTPWLPITGNAPPGHPDHIPPGSATPESHPKHGITAEERDRRQRMSDPFGLIGGRRLGNQHVRNNPDLAGIWGWNGDQVKDLSGRWLRNGEYRRAFNRLPGEMKGWLSQGGSMNVDELEHLLGLSQPDPGPVGGGDSVLDVINDGAGGVGSQQNAPGPYDALINARGTQVDPLFNNANLWNRWKY